MSINRLLVDVEEDPDEQRDIEINTEMEATAAAYEIFLNVAPPGARYIEQSDLLRFMTEDEVDHVWPLIDEAMTGQVDRKTLTEWVVKVYTARKALAHALADTKAVTVQVDNLVTCIVCVIIIIVSLLVVEIATTSFIVFLSSQQVLAAFAFGNTSKNVFESVSVMFHFVAHPYDIGDCIVFEGSPQSHEKSIYERCCRVLNCYTPVEKIVKLKEKIKEYIEGKPQYWHPKHNVAVIDIQDNDKLKMAIYCQYKMSFHDFEKKNLRRAELNFELLKILEEQNITLLSDPPKN